MIQNLVAFTIAAILEILGSFTFWLWLRRGTSPTIAALGVLSLIGFAVALTRVDAAFAGRAYAAYGGIYILASLIWLWLVEGQQPTGSDMVGAGWPSSARSSSLAWGLEPDCPFALNTLPPRVFCEHSTPRRRLYLETRK